MKRWRPLWQSAGNRRGTRCPCSRTARPATGGTRRPPSWPDCWSVGTWNPFVWPISANFPDWGLSVYFSRQFFGGWWFAIDAAAVYPEKTDLKDVFHICGVFATLSLFMCVTISIFCLGFYGAAAVFSDLRLNTIGYNAVPAGSTRSPAGSLGARPTRRGAWGRGGPASGSSWGS